MLPQETHLGIKTKGLKQRGKNGTKRQREYFSSRNHVPQVKRTLIKDSRQQGAVTFIYSPNAGSPKYVKANINMLKNRHGTCL